MTFTSECPADLHMGKVRTSGRFKRTPITRNEDFSWTTSFSRTTGSSL